MSDWTAALIFLIGEADLGLVVPETRGQGEGSRKLPPFQSSEPSNQPKTLIVWGKNDYIFPPEGATPYKRDLPDVETHLLDTGHFALETHGEEIASRIEHFFEHHG